MVLEDITEFLPKYPSMGEVDQYNPYDENFYQAIYKKKEVYDFRLDKTETLPENPGDLMAHQTIISRLFSSYTPYDSLLLFHEMGTGKTCSAVSAAEKIKSENNGITGAIYFAKGEALLNNFMNELIFKCTDGRYVPEDFEGLTKMEKVRRKKKSIGEFYTLKTFETFAKQVSQTPANILRENYSNKIIIIDEVHNLRIQSKEKGLSIYNQFYKFLHSVKDCKILLMSGTPMKDSPEEIASIMNLILPEEQKLPTGEEFMNEFFDKETNKVKENMIPVLKNVFKGRVSYMKAMQSDVEKKFEGKKAGDLQFLKVVEDKMSEFQTEHYGKAYISDRDDRKGVYSKSRQAALFVFPDGSYGEEGFKKFISKSERRAVTQDEDRKQKMYNYGFKNELYNQIKADTKEKMLKNLEKFSSKYAASMRTILKAIEENKSVFIYNEFVKGGGLILFGVILEMFGFTKARGNEPEGSEALRYANLTNVTSTTQEIRNLVDRFNKPDNVDGKIINVIMGSRVISEGFSLQNIQVEDIHTPWFNYSETSQAIARGYRLGSHKTLVEKGITPILDIYQRVSVASNSKFRSIDLFMYETSEKKDIVIKGIERLMKESAIDCALTYKRSKKPGNDGLRDCEYDICEYNCDGVPMKMINDGLSMQEQDYSTYQLYYNNNALDNIITDIINIFKTTFRIEFKTLEGELTDYTTFEILTALRKIINESMPIVNMYGLVSYVKEENNIFFLIDNLSVVGILSSEYYTQYPHIKEPYDFSKIITPLYLESLPKAVEEVFKADNINELRKAINKLPIEIHEELIEGSLLSKERNIDIKRKQREMILEYFKNYYDSYDGVWVSWLLYNDEDQILRCLESGKWGDCSDKYRKILESKKKDEQKSLETNPYGYYGQFRNFDADSEKNKLTGNFHFCIRDVSEGIEEKGNKRKSGKQCQTWQKPDLLRLAIKFKIPIPDDDDPDIENNDFTDPTSRSQIKKNKKIVDKINDKNSAWKSIQSLTNKRVTSTIEEIGITNPDDYTLQELKRILFFAKLMVKPLCCVLQIWFKNKKLWQEDPDGCGKGDKKKPVML